MKKDKKKFILIVIVTITFILGVIASVYFALNSRPMSVSNNVLYMNTDYGFSVTLPLGWKGYTVSTSTWTGSKNDNVIGEYNYTTGPLISIHNPKWTKEIPYQDIPIMVFTLDQWQELSQEVFIVGAAPIGPTELVRNGQYVFALPARYNYAYPPGYEEVDQIISMKPFKAF